MSETLHDRLFEDLAFLYSKECRFSDEIKDGIKKDISWMWTDSANLQEKRSAKYLGCGLWSKEALNVLYEMDWETKKPIRKKTGSDYQRYLRHEHVYPRKDFKESCDAFFKHGYSENELYEFKEKLEEFFCGCVITKEEDRHLPRGSNAHVEFSSLSTKEYWSRYRDYNEAHKDNPIEVYKCKWESNGRSWNLVCVSRVEME